MCRARKRSRRGSGKAEIFVSWTVIVPAVGSDTPAMRLRSVVLPEPLGPVRTVQLPAETAQRSMLSAWSVRPFSSGNAFFTPCRATAADTSVISRRCRRGAALDAPPAITGLPDGDGVDRHADPTSQQQRPEDEEELVRLVLSQLIEVEDLHDVGAAVPEEIGVNRQREIPKGLSLILRVWRESPLQRRVVRADRHDVHVVEEFQRVRPDAWLWLMPLRVRRIETPGGIRLVPRLAPARPHQQDVALADLDVLRLRGVLQVL